MTREPERVGAGFVRTAPVRLVFTARAAAPPEAVCAAAAASWRRSWPRSPPSATPTASTRWVSPVRGLDRRAGRA
ncbi:hypothetical protein [Streptomyces pini]|uniref:Uncharacterized protein n=1 Tax=Streptomyces pini TaxID=1520580 RepID=A0A1I4CTY3_9ACTN|nr:hypothetical protein SAMN05192584_109131 [Streptomyces pini]